MRDAYCVMRKAKNGIKKGAEGEPSAPLACFIDETFGKQFIINFAQAKEHD